MALVTTALFAHVLFYNVFYSQSFVLPNTPPGSPSMSHYRGAEEFFDRIEDGADDFPTSNMYTRRTYSEAGPSLAGPLSAGSSLARSSLAFPENDGYLFGGIPEIPGVIGDGAPFGEGITFLEENEPMNGNGEVDKLNLLLALEKSARWTDLQSFLERQEKKLVDVGHLTADESWPKANVTKQMAQTTGVTICGKGIVHGLHRGGRQWFEAFDLNSKTKKDLKPIDKNVVISIDPKTGLDLKKSWGKNLFYMPHGLNIDHLGNFWITDIASHQVLKFKWSDRQRPSLVLGEKFVSGSDSKHFCKPTDVAVAASTGDVFISDGYCNSRILKLDKKGNVLHIWGKQTPSKLQGPTAPRDTLSIPHSIHLDETRDMVCVADRENERIVCFIAGLKNPKSTGKVKRVFTNESFGRIFAIAIAPKLGVIYGVSAPVGEQPSQGFTLDIESGEILDRWTKSSSSSLSSSPSSSLSSISSSPAKTDVGLGEMPHDIEVSPIDGAVYVAQVEPAKIIKFKHVQY